MQANAQELPLIVLRGRSSNIRRTVSLEKWELRMPERSCKRSNAVKGAPQIALRGFQKATTPSASGEASLIPERLPSPGTSRSMASWRCPNRNPVFWFGTLR